MQPTRSAIAIASLALLTGCPTPRQYSFRINTATGACEVVYGDLRSEEKSDSGMAGDWTILKGMAASRDSTFDSTVVKVVSQQLFKQDTVLSGKRVYKVKCPKCFPSKVAMLEYLRKAALALDERLSWREVNGDIYLFCAEDLGLRQTNGTVLHAPHSDIAVWSGADTLFEFAFGPDSVEAGRSLLPYYLKEPAKAAKKGK
jgi:hypothetical protein